MYMHIYYILLLYLTICLFWSSWTLSVCICDICCSLFWLFKPGQLFSMKFYPTIASLEMGTEHVVLDGQGSRCKRPAVVQGEVPACDADICSPFSFFVLTLCLVLMWEWVTSQFVSGLVWSGPAKCGPAPPEETLSCLATTVRWQGCTFKHHSISTHK